MNITTGIFVLNPQELMQLCFCGVCIPLECVIPVILGWLYWMGIDLTRFLPPAWRRTAHAQVAEAKDAKDNSSGTQASINSEQAEDASARSELPVPAGDGAAAKGGRNLRSRA
jgi:hypothetical protein